MTRRSPSPIVLLALLAVGLLLAAAAPPDASPEELIRQANAVFPGNPDEADRLYAAAEERTSDPGLIAFNRAAVLVGRKNYSRAEEYYTRVLADAACPPERAARACYNRGTCRLHAGTTKEEFWRAIEDLQWCLDSPAADVRLKANARRNLELAKLAWDMARRKEAQKTGKPPASPNDNPAPEEHRPRQVGTTQQQPGTPEPGDGNTGATAKPTVQPKLVPNPGTQPTGTPQNPTPANAPNLQPLQDADTVQPLTPEQTRQYLAQAAERLKRERQALLRTLYAPDRPGNRDW